MTILIGIIGFHFLIILRAKQSNRGKVPYITTFFLTVLMVIYVVVMMHTIEPPPQ